MHPRRQNPGYAYGLMSDVTCNHVCQTRINDDNDEQHQGQGHDKVKDIRPTRTLVVVCSSLVSLCVVVTCLS